MLNRTAFRIALIHQQLQLKELAPRAGIDLLRLYRISSGVVEPRKDELRSLAKVLRVTVSHLKDANA